MLLKLLPSLPIQEVCECGRFWQPTPLTAKQNVKNWTVGKRLALGFPPLVAMLLRLGALTSSRRKGAEIPMEGDCKNF
jgi:hypothetical protein